MLASGNARTAQSRSVEMIMEADLELLSLLSPTFAKTNPISSNSFANGQSGADDKSFDLSNNTKVGGVVVEKLGQVYDRRNISSPSSWDL
jgi:hypothetical protein